MSWSRQIANLEFEVERLRAELARWQKIAARLDDDMEALATNLARRDEQIAAVLGLHLEERLGEDRPGASADDLHCIECEHPYPCETRFILDGVS